MHPITGVWAQGGTVREALTLNQALQYSAPAGYADYLMTLDPNRFDVTPEDIAALRVNFDSYMGGAILPIDIFAVAQDNLAGFYFFATMEELSAALDARVAGGEERAPLTGTFAHYYNLEG